MSGSFPNQYLLAKMLLPMAKTAVSIKGTGDFYTPYSGGGVVKPPGMTGDHAKVSMIH